MIQRPYIHNGTSWVEFNTGGFRNKIINGDFQIWQRSNDANVDISTNGTFFADRWSKGGSSGSATALLNTSATSDLPFTEAGIGRYVRWWQTAAPTVSQSINTKIEDVRTLNGKTVTLSFYARLAAGSFPFNISYSQYGGDTGSSGFFGPYQITEPIKDMSGNIVTSPTASWARYYVTFNILPLAGRMNVAATGNDYLQIQFSSPSSGTWQIDLTGVQLERGSVPTDFEQLPPAVKLSLCQRYYYVIAQSGKDFNYPVTRESTTQNQFMVISPVSLRTRTPILEKPAQTAGRFVYRDTAFNVVASAVTNANLSLTNATFSANGFMLVGVGSTAVAGTYVYAEFDTLGAGTGNLALNAEL